MRILKPILAGFAAIFAAFGVLVTGIMITLPILSARHPDESIGWDPISLTSPVTTLVFLAVFLAGFLFQLRRQNKNGRISPAAPTTKISMQ